MATETVASPAGAVTNYREHEAELLLQRKTAEAEGIVALVLTEPSGADLPEWSPGAHIDVVLEDSLTRQYSLCGSTKDRHSYRVGVLRDPKSRGGSSFIHDKLEEGDLVRIRGPRNHFPLIDVPEYIFIAGGIGVTPMIPMIAAAAGRGANWRLLYGGRQRASMGFVEELAAYGDRVSFYPQDEVGFIPLPSVLSEPRPDTLIYCCGPELLLEAVEGLAQNWPPGSLHTERFSAKPMAASPSALATFEVVCQRSGITITVDEGKSILSACEAAGMTILASCRDGVCGTCEAAVLEGAPDHRDSVLSADERAANEYMMICISRSLTPRLVLDI